MNRSSVLLGTVAVLAGVIAIAWTGSAALNARREMTSAQSSYETTLQQLTELHSLQERKPAIAPDTAGSEDLTRRVTRSLSASGLPSSAMTNLSPDAEQAAGSARSPDGKPLYLHRSARLTLEGLTLPELGKFLDAWRTAEPGWTVSNIDLTAGQLSDGGRIKPTPTTPISGPASNRDMPLHVLLTIESIVAVESSSQINS